MAYSAALKALLLAAGDLVYRTKVEIENEDGDWVDFGSRDPIVGTTSVQGDRSGNRITGSTSSVSFTNDDQYFDYMDDPGATATTTAFGTLATKFSKGFKDARIRVSLVFLLPGGTWEAAPLGVFRLKTRSSDPATQRVTFTLGTDIDFLKTVGVQALSDGYMQYNNRPVSFLVRQILKRIYPGGVTDSEFLIPDRIVLATEDGEPAFSKYGKPPELDTAGRWRDDILAAPTCIYYHEASGYFYAGVGDEVWRMSPTAERWSLCGSFGDDDVLVKGIYEMTSTRLLVVGWEYNQDDREQVCKTAQLLTSSGSMTTNDPSYWMNIYGGEFVLRDTWHSGGGGVAEPIVGRVANWSHMVGIDHMAGINMPCPFPQWPHLGAGSSGMSKAMAMVAGSRTQPASGDWIDLVLLADPPHGIDVPEPCYIAAGIVEVPAGTTRPCLKVYWGMRPSIAYTASFADTDLTDTPWVFVVGTDGDPLGIRCPGGCWIVGIDAYTGTDHVLSAEVTGNRVPFYDLRYFSLPLAPVTPKDYLSWIEIDWVEEFIDVDGGGTPANCDSPIGRIVYSRIYDDGSGGPEIDLVSGTEEAWQAGDDEFAADDSSYIPTHAIPFKIGNIHHWLVQVLKTESVGGACFELFFCDNPITGGTTNSLGTSKYGWGGFTLDAAGSKIYFIERDSGRVCVLDISTHATAYDVLGDGEEPVAQANYEMPSAQDSMVVRTELSKTCLYSISHPAAPGLAFQSRTWPAGKYYLWKYHPELTDRIELFDEGKMTAWEALGLLAEAIDYTVGMDPEAVGFFSPKPTSAGSDICTLDLDGSSALILAAVKLDGLDEIVNRSEFIPYEVAIGLPEASLDLVGYLEGTAQKYFNGQTEIRSESILETVISLSCVKEGDPGTAAFKYMIHENIIQTALREDTVIATAPRQLRVESNADLEEDMLVQVGDVDESGGVAYFIDSIQVDGDIILNQDLPANFAQGTEILFRKVNDAKWSTEYAAPLTYTSSASFAEIGEAGLFLKFTADSTPNRFAVGDRIIVKNPGQKLERSKTQKFTVEDTASREEHGLAEYNFNNQFMSFAIGKQRSIGEVTVGKQPRHGWKIKTALLVQAKVNGLVKVRSKKLLPVATNNEERCVIRSVVHDPRNGETTMELRALASY